MLVVYVFYLRSTYSEIVRYSSDTFPNRASFTSKNLLYDGFRTLEPNIPEQIFALTSSSLMKFPFQFLQSISLMCWRRTPCRHDIKSKNCCQKETASRGILTGIYVANGCQCCSGVVKGLFLIASTCCVCRGQEGKTDEVRGVADGC